MPIGGPGDDAFVHRVLVVGLVFALALMLWHLVAVLLLVFGAVLVAVLLRAAAVPIDRHTGIGDNLALLLATLLVVGFISLALTLFGADIRAQTFKLIETLPDAWDLFVERALALDLGDEIMGRAEEAVPAAGQMIGNVLLGAWSVAGGMAGTLVVIVGGLYLAAQPDMYRRGFLLLLPDDGKRARGAETLDATGEALQLWLLGQLLTMAFIFAMTLAGLWLIGVPAALALAVFAGLAQFVPVVGPIVASVPALLVALTESWEMVLWVLGLYVAIQQIESNLVTPLVQRRTVQLPPAVPLFAVVVFGALFGFLGVLFATPLAVVAFVAINKLWVRDALGEETRLPGEPATPEDAAQGAATDLAAQRRPRK